MKQRNITNKKLSIYIYIYISISFNILLIKKKNDKIPLICIDNQGQHKKDILIIQSILFFH